MKIAGIRELRARSAALLGGDEPVLVTRHGKVSGIYMPLEAPGKLPDDVRREFIGALGHHLDKVLALQKVTDSKIGKDFRAHRRRRR